MSETCVRRKDLEYRRCQTETRANIVMFRWRDFEINFLNIIYMHWLQIESGSLLYLQSKGQLLWGVISKVKETQIWEDWSRRQRDNPQKQKKKWSYQVLYS